MYHKKWNALGTDTSSERYSCNVCCAEHRIIQYLLGSILLFQSSLRGFSIGFPAFSNWENLCRKQRACLPQRHWLETIWYWQTYNSGFTRKSIWSEKWRVKTRKKCVTIWTDKYGVLNNIKRSKRTCAPNVLIAQATRIRRVELHSKIECVWRLRRDLPSDWPRRVQPNLNNKLVTKRQWSKQQWGNNEAAFNETAPIKQRQSESDIEQMNRL